MIKTLIAGAASIGALLAAGAASAAVVTTGSLTYDTDNYNQHGILAEALDSAAE